MKGFYYPRERFAADFDRLSPKERRDVATIWEHRVRRYGMTPPLPPFRPTAEYVYMLRDSVKRAVRRKAKPNG